MNAVPLVDLRKQYLSIRSEIDTAIQRVIEGTAFIGGEELYRFEAEFAGYCEVEHCVGVGNGTDAIHLALRALGVGAGDEVITVSHTFIATAEAISAVGARPVFVDVCDDTLVMDPALLERAVTPLTRAIVPVHLYGQMCDMTAVMDVARRHGLKVVEDAAQAHGARWRGRRAGAFGDLACFSFYPGKNLGAYGDAGAVVGNDGELVARIRTLADHGRLDKYTHGIVGMNSRLDGLQAAVLRVKLRSLDRWNQARRRHARHYGELFRGTHARPVMVHADADPVWHLYVVRVPDPGRVQAGLKQQGVATGVHYPVPVHLQPAYRELGIDIGSLPVTECAAREIVSLPLYPELTDSEVEAIAEVVRHCVS